MNRSPFFLFLFIVLFSCNQAEKKDIRRVIASEKIKKDALLYQVKGDTLRDHKKFDSAFYFYLKSKTKFDLVKDTAHLGYCLIQIARCQQTYGDYFGSETSLVEALPYIKGNKDYESAANNLFGVSSKELKNFDAAIGYYQNTYTLAGTCLGKVIALNNIANVYSEEGNYRKAVNILNKVLKNKFLDTIPERKAIYMNNLGYAYTKINEKEKGLKLMLDALALANKAGDSYRAIQIYLYLSEYYTSIDAQKAHQYALSAYKESTLHNSIDERLKALLLLIKSSSYNRNFAIHYATLNDSIDNIRRKSKNQFFKLRYDSRVEKEENLKLINKNIVSNLELQKSQNEKNIWISGVAVLAMLLIVLINYFKNKRKEDRLKASYLTETRIAKKVHDELANDVFHTMSYAETKPLHESLYKEELINLLDGIYQRSRNISKENDSIDTGEKFETFLIEMLNSYKTSERNVIIKTDNPVNWPKINNEKKVAIYRVLQELMVNMKKYSQANLVIIGFDVNSYSIIIEYTDNGIGILADQIKKGGLLNVENRIKTIDGTFIFETINKGCKIKITFPK